MKPDAVTTLTDEIVEGFGRRAVGFAREHELALPARSGEAEIVTTDGQLCRASRDEHPDL